MEPQELSIKVVVDYDKKTVEVAGADIKELGKTIEEKTGQTKKGVGAWKELAGAFGLGALAGMGAATALKMLTGFIQEGIRSAIEEERVMRELAFTLETVGQSFSALRPEIEAYLDRVVTTTMFQDTETARVLSRMIKLTGDYQTAVRLTNLAMDLATVSGKDLTTTSEKLTSAIVYGERGVRLLRREFGELVGDADTAGEAFAHLEKRVGGARETIQTTEKQAVIFRKTIGEIGEDIGKVLLPALSGLMKGLHFIWEVLKGIVTMFITFGIVATENIWKIITGQSNLIQSIKDVGTVMSGVFNQIIKGTEEVAKQQGKISETIKGTTDIAIGSMTKEDELREKITKKRIELEADTQKKLRMMMEEELKQYEGAIKDKALLAEYRKLLEIEIQRKIAKEQEQIQREQAEKEKEIRQKILEKRLELEATTRERLYAILDEELKEYEEYIKDKALLDELRRLLEIETERKLAEEKRKIQEEFERLRIERIDDNVQKELEQLKQAYQTDILNYQKMLEEKRITDEEFNRFKRERTELLTQQVQQYWESWVGGFQGQMEIAKSISLETTRMMSSEFAKLFESVILGGENMWKSLDQFFKNIADAFIKMLVRMFAEFMAKKIMFAVLGAVLPGLGIPFGMMPPGLFGMFQKGGVVPRTAPYLLHKGERVIPARTGFEEHIPTGRPINIVLNIQTLDTRELPTVVKERLVRDILPILKREL